MRITINNKRHDPNRLDIFDVLFLIFIVLKLTGLVHYSWLWVSSPILIGLGITGVIPIINHFRSKIR